MTGLHGASRDPRAGHLRTLAGAAAVFLLALLIYWPARDFPFVILDDPHYVSENPRLLDGLSAGGLAWALTSIDNGFWIPLTRLSYLAETHFFGRDPRVMHLTNILLHGLNGALLFLLWHGLTGAWGRSLGLALLFAAHPLRVESVAWITERKDVLFTLLWLMAVIAYLRFVRHPSSGRMVLVASLYVLSLTAKPMGVTLPVVLLLLDSWPLGRCRGAAGPLGPVTGAGAVAQLLREKLPLFAIAALFAGTTMIAMHRDGGLVTEHPLPVALGNAVLSCGRYLLKTVWPADLAVVYPHPGSGVSWPAVALSAAALAALTRWAWSRPALRTGWLWFLLTLVPVLGFPQSGLQAMADRFTYVPHIGLFAALAWWGGGAVPRVPRAVAAAALAAAVAALAAASRAQLGHWQDSQTLLRHTLEITRENFMAEANLGAVLLDRPETMKESIAHSLEARRLRAQDSRPDANLALAYEQLGRLEDAERHFRSALEKRPAYLFARVRLARLLAVQGRFEEASVAFREALRLEPRNADTLNNLGVALVNSGRPAEAVEIYLQALQERPEFAEAESNLGNALLLLGRADEAADRFRRALRIRPDLTPPRVQLEALGLSPGDGGGR